MGVRKGGGGKGALAPPLASQKKYVFGLFLRKIVCFTCFLGKKYVLAPPPSGKKSADAHDFMI